MPSFVDAGDVSYGSRLSLSGGCGILLYLRSDLQCAVTIAYSYGWRMQSEVLTLTLSQVDFSAVTLRHDLRRTAARDLIVRASRKS